METDADARAAMDCLVRAVFELVWVGGHIAASAATNLRERPFSGAVLESDPVRPGVFRGLDSRTPPDPVPVFF